MILTIADKKLLLLLARNAIVNRIDPGNPQLSIIPDPTDSVQLNCGAFVSLYVEGDLRGCIGTFSEEDTLYKNVKKMAESAATSDSRFSPVKFCELEKMKIEISVLSPKERIYDKGDIILGKHGIYMEKGLNRGTLLPQVAISQNWSVDEFLGNCAKYKAGIGWDGWKTADLYLYEAFVFDSMQTISDC